jgi:hypothetical protein
VCKVLDGLLTGLVPCTEESAGVREGHGLDRVSNSVFSMHAAGSQEHPAIRDLQRIVPAGVYLSKRVLLCAL